MDWLRCSPLKQAHFRTTPPLPVMLRVRFVPLHVDIALSVFSCCPASSAPPPHPRGARSQGLSLGRLVGVILKADPSILVTSMLATTTVFVCFALAALLAKRRSFLYLGGILSSATLGE